MTKKRGNEQGITAWSKTTGSKARLFPSEGGAWVLLAAEIKKILFALSLIKISEIGDEPATVSSSQNGTKMTPYSLHVYSLTYWVPFQSHIVYSDYSHLLAVIYFKAETCKTPWLHVFNLKQGQYKNCKLDRKSYWWKINSEVCRMWSTTFFCQMHWRRFEREREREKREGEMWKCPKENIQDSEK